MDYFVEYICLKTVNIDCASFWILFVFIEWRVRISVDLLLVVRERLLQGEMKTYCNSSGHNFDFVLRSINLVAALNSPWTLRTVLVSNKMFSNYFNFNFIAYNIDILWPMVQIAIQYCIKIFFFGFFIYENHSLYAIR